MPKRTDIKTILVLGSGPIVIGQGCEFDYSGTQACKTLKQEGYRIVLVNSNPATIMTDPQFSDRTYIEPITPQAVAKIIEKENALGPRIDAILPTLGGQTALNCACKLFDDGTLAKHGVEMIGANREVIHRAEDRQIFKDICEKIGLKLPKAKAVNTMAEAEAFLEEIGLPAIIRPAFTLGGSGGGIAYNKDEFRDIVARGLAASMITQVQIDQSVIGWKEFELEVVRDKKDNCIIVCGIENIDPMGVHTGDSITVAPILTLTDKEYQAMRDAAFAVMRAVGVETGGSNVQFAVNPNPTPGPDGKKPFEMVVVEMNPRVSRSSALASKATGFPIAKIAAKLAVGYTLDELKNDITGNTSACFEPSIDYIVTKMPRWTFEKFPEADETLTTQMKSVGEAMAIGRTLKESLQKAIRSMDVKRFGLGLDRNDKWLAAMRAVEHDQLMLDVMGGPQQQAQQQGQQQAGGTAASSDTGLRTADGNPIEWPIPLEKLVRKLTVPSQGRLYYVRYAFKMGWSIARIAEHTNIDPFFLDQIKQLVEFEDVLCDYKNLEDVPADILFEAKQMGYSDAQLANLYMGEISSDAILKVRQHRIAQGIEPVYKLVDTCAAEFEAVTPYYYSTYERPSTSTTGKKSVSPYRGDDEIRITDREKVIILGGGPNRIGQGIEFDYCCCHAAFAADDLGFESVMINSNPETVSTDYDTSDLLFFEPLTLEDTLNIVDRLRGNAGPATVEVLCKRQIEEYFSDPKNPPRPQNMIEAITDAASRASLGPIAIFDLSTLYGDPDVADDNAVGFYAVSADGRSWEINFEPPRKGSTAHVAYDGMLTWKSRASAYECVAEVAPAVDQWLSKQRSLIRGLIVQFGGQTPLNLAKGLVAAGAPIIGTSVDSIDLAEDRDRFDALLTRLNLQRPPAGIARSLDEAVKIADQIGYPVLLRPSYVLGGRGMEICSDEKALRSFIATALREGGLDDAPVLIDKFLDGAIEVDVDVVADFDPTGASKDGDAVIAGIMEQIEQAGIHSGDSACTLPPVTLSQEVQRRIRDLARSIARELNLRGLMNIQLAVKDDEIYIIEVNPRASRTVPFVSKTTHIPWPAIAAKAMMGQPLAPQVKNTAYAIGKDAPTSAPRYFAVKESVFPFSKFPGVDVVLGPEMRSTGEVMGIDRTFPIAFAKSQMAAGIDLPTNPEKGAVFVSVREQDRASMLEPVRVLLSMGWTVYASPGTAQYLSDRGLSPKVLQKIAAGARPNVIDLMTNGQLALIINTPTRTGWKTDEGRIRASAVRMNVPMITTTTAAAAAVKAIAAMREQAWDVAPLQDYLKLHESRLVEPRAETSKV